MELLKKLFRDVFNATLSINGFGDSVDDPIIIHAQKDGVAIEYKIIAFIQQLKKKEYSIDEQQFIDLRTTKIDKITVTVMGTPTTSRIFYFDITKSFLG